ncbi:MAG: hypothetical protein AAB554_04580 [Patescibacteria group bacterium]
MRSSKKDVGLPKAIRIAPFRQRAAVFFKRGRPPLATFVGNSDEVRTAQAKRLWCDIGVARELGFSSFEAYLATIPEIPEALLKHDPGFPLRVLVETRVGLKRLCGLGGVVFPGCDETFVEHDERHREFAQPTWILVQDGRKNRNRAVRDCRKSFAKDELGLTVLQGVCTYLHHPQAVTEMTRVDSHVMDLSGSLPRGDRGGAAFLGLWGGQPELHWYWGDRARPQFGSASRRECKVL